MSTVMKQGILAQLNYCLAYDNGSLRIFTYVNISSLSEQEL
jgi:hypothetical protein